MEQLLPIPYFVCGSLIVYDLYKTWQLLKLHFFLNRGIIYYRLSGRVLALHSVVAGLKSEYTLLMRPSKVETAVQWFCMLHAVLAGFSGHGN